MPSKSKTKGSAFERDVAKALTEAFGLPFTRSSGSGAWRGGKNAARRATTSVQRDRTGDVVAPDELQPWVIECKRYAKIPDLLDGPSAMVDGWIDQLEFDCAKGAFGTLVYKADSRPARIMMNLGVPGLDRMCHHRGEGGEEEWWVYRLDDFLGDSLARQFLINSIANGTKGATIG